MNEPVSFCTICDALPDECDHTGPRYLEDLIYEKVPLGETVGYRVPVRERERWDDDTWRGDRAQQGDNRPTAPSLDAITDLLEPYVVLSTNVRAVLTEKYAASAHQTYQVAVDICRSSDRLDNPTGALIRNLRQIV